MTTLKLGLYELAVKFLHLPKGRNIYLYRRQIPKGLRHHYSSPQILKSLETSNEVQAIKRCREINHSVEQEFSRLNAGYPRKPELNYFSEATALLLKFGLSKSAFDNHDEGAAMRRDVFHDYLDDVIRNGTSKEKYEAFFFSNESAYQYLPDVERTALELLRGDFSLSASQFLDQHVELLGRTSDTKFIQGVANAKKFLLKHLNDKPPSQYDRTEVRLLMNAGIENGLKTQTVKRYLTTIRAAFNNVALELELDSEKHHPFTDFKVPQLGDDSKDREDFTFEELQQVRWMKEKRKPEITWLIQLMLETGMRVNEVCGLQVGDINLEHDFPHLAIHRNTFRRLKTKGSQRFIPLIGIALEAATKAIAGSKGVWLFPSYIDFEKQTTKNNQASGATNKQIRSVLGQAAPTAHSFRHTMQTRLRQVDCPESLRNELGGWVKTVSESYGSSKDLRRKTKYLRKVLDQQHLS